MSMLRRLTIRRGGSNNTVERLPQSPQVQAFLEAQLNQNPRSVQTTKHNIKQRYNFNEIIKKIDKYYKDQRSDSQIELDDWIENEIEKYQRRASKWAKVAEVAKRENSSNKTLVKTDSKKTLAKYQKSNSRKKSNSSKKTNNKKRKRTSSKNNSNSKNVKKIGRMLI